MPHILKNNNVEVYIDSPLENYHFSRFDWTGKIAQVKFKGIPLSIIEILEYDDENIFGKGFYNEFGMDAAPGFEEAEIGEWFHKIGIGLLKKDSSEYIFNKEYEVKPAEFELISSETKITIICISETVNGYAYLLKKEVEIQENGFVINYSLENTGEKEIITDEYVHNFMNVNGEFMGSNYELHFPFPLDPELFDESVNPDGVIHINQNTITFNNPTEEQFFFSNITGSKSFNASWELLNHKSNIGVKETASFDTDKINLWGWQHVISPELFFKISLQPSKTVKWSRRYEMYEV